MGKYKREQIAGVYRVYEPISGESFIGYSYNVLGTFNRWKLEFAMNACTVRALQQFWNEHNGNIEMEILEKIPLAPDTEPDPEELEDSLQAIAKHYVANYKNAHLLQVEG